MERTYTIEYSLGGIKTKDDIRVNDIDNFIDYLMNIKTGREKLINKNLTINIIDIKRKK